MCYYKKSLVIFGGISSRAEPHVFRLDLATKTWNNTDLEMDRIEVKYYRFGHTASLYGNFMIVFGGEV